MTVGGRFQVACCRTARSLPLRRVFEKKAIYFGNASGHAGQGVGPWVMADLENGLWPANVPQYLGNPSMTGEYVTAMVKGGENGFTLKGGDAQTGFLDTLYSGPRPLGYQPMKKQGSIILGIGGDNSAWAHGTCQVDLPSFCWDVLVFV